MGEIKLSRGATSITLKSDLQVQRRAGRPESQLEPLPTEDLPRYIDKQRPAYDSFELGGTFHDANAAPDTKTLIESILRPPLGTGTLTLEFVNGLYDLDTYTVVPVGGQAGRASYRAGEQGMARIDNLEVRVVA